MSQLWVDKHRPQRLNEIIGQQLAVKEVLEWVNSWRPGKGMLLSGGPGIGKTLLVETLARERGLELLQMNASDKRTPDEIKSFLGQTSKQMSLFSRGKIILVDEVDGISGGERGAGAAIVKVIKESKFPVFLIANDPWVQKLAPVRAYCKHVKMKNVHMYDIMKALKAVAEKEGIETAGNTVRYLAKWASGDLRSAINDFQMIAEGRKSLEEKDLEILGYREREASVFDSLPAIFHSKNIKAARKAIQEADRDPDEMLLWIETNATEEMPAEALADVFDLLSKADIFRRRVSVQQNWRFKAYMVDLMSGVSLFRGDYHRKGFAPYKSPDRISMLGRTKAARELRKATLKKLGSYSHCSMKKAKGQLPLIKLALKKGDLARIAGLTEEEAKAL